MRYVHPYIWFLSCDPVENAKCLSDRDLYTNITHIAQLLLATYVYSNGIHNGNLALKLFKHDKDYFILKHFPYFPDIRSHISFVPFKKCKNFIKWILLSKVHFNILVKHFLAEIDEYKTRLRSKTHKLQFLEEYFIEYPSITKDEILKSSNLEYALNISYKFPAQFRKKTIIDTFRHLYKLRYPKGVLFSKYSQEIPEWLLY